MREDVMIATAQAKTERAYYLQWIARRLKLPSRQVAYDLYKMGKLHNCFPVPATLDNGESACNWLTLSICPLNVTEGRPCLVCIEQWMDQILYDFPSLD